MKKLFLLIPFIVIFFACSDKESNKEQIQKNNKKKEAINSDNLINAVAWFQQSSEAQACFFQAFNLAKNQLLVNIENAKTDLPLALITDIDETMLDNSPFEGYLIKNNVQFSGQLWSKWVNLACAEPMPGAVDFTIFAKNNNVEVFYVSNRSVENISATIKNLKDKGFAFADSSHIFLKDSTSNKTYRRNIIAQNYNIIMFLGDNLRDFDEIFKNRQINFGKNTVEENKNLFGKKYFILPNPMYGQWMKAYNNKNGETTPQEKHQNIIKTLLTFKENN